MKNGQKRQDLLKEIKEKQAEVVASDKEAGQMGRLFGEARLRARGTPQMTEGEFQRFACKVLGLELDFEKSREKSRETLTAAVDLAVKNHIDRRSKRRATMKEISGLARMRRAS